MADFEQVFDWIHKKGRLFYTPYHPKFYLVFDHDVWFDENYEFRSKMTFFYNFIKIIGFIKKTRKQFFLGLTYAFFHALKSSEIYTTNDKLHPFHFHNLKIIITFFIRVRTDNPNLIRAGRTQIRVTDVEFTDGGGIIEGSI